MVQSPIAKQHSFTVTFRFLKYSRSRADLWLSIAKSFSSITSGLHFPRRKYLPRPAAHRVEQTERCEARSNRGAPRASSSQDARMAEPSSSNPHRQLANEHKDKHVQQTGFIPCVGARNDNNPLTGVYDPSVYSPRSAYISFGQSAGGHDWPVMTYDLSPPRPTGRTRQKEHIWDKHGGGGRATEASAVDFFLWLGRQWLLLLRRTGPVPVVEITHR